MYTENYKTSLKEIKDINKWKDSSCSWIGRLSITKMTALPKMMYVSKQSLSKIPMTFFVKELDLS